MTDLKKLEKIQVILCEPRERLPLLESVCGPQYQKTLHHDFLVEKLNKICDIFFEKDKNGGYLIPENIRKILNNKTQPKKGE